MMLSPIRRKRPVLDQYSSRCWNGLHHLYTQDLTTANTAIHCTTVLL